MHTTMALGGAGRCLYCMCRFWSLTIPPSSLLPHGQALWMLPGENVMNMMVGKKKGQSSLSNVWLVLPGFTPFRVFSVLRSKRHGWKDGKRNTWYCLHDYAVWIALPFVVCVCRWCQELVKKLFLNPSNVAWGTLPPCCSTESHLNKHL